VKYSSDRNEQPSTPTRQSDEYDLDSVEAKFQLSLKSKLWDNLIGDNGDIWGGYTQVSNWEAYNSDSAPFRETNYMPEIFVSWRTGVDLGPLRWQFVNLGLRCQGLHPALHGLRRVADRLQPQTDHRRRGRIAGAVVVRPLSHFSRAIAAGTAVRP
jgi:hypothetical protein